MITEIRNNLYKIEVPLKGNPLRVLNSYFIKSDDKELLIDTGFQTEDCLDALTKALAELGSVPEHRDVFLTHFHSDHIGNGHLLKGPGRTIYMSEIDHRYVVNFRKASEKNRRSRSVSEGFLQEWIDENAKSNPAWRYDIQFEPEESFTCLHDGDVISVGEYVLKIVIVPGHTPGQMMLYDEKDKIMFTADHILFDITPNITNYNNVEDSLGDYLKSLKRADGYDVDLALPGHRESGDYHARIAELLAHHEQRIAQALSVVKDNPGLNAVEICSRMTWSIRAKNWDDFPVSQKWYAVGETLSHLDYLRLRGKIKREMQGEIWHYFAE